MAYGSDFGGRRDSGRLPKPAVPPGFQERMSQHGHGGQQPEAGDWRGRDGYEAPGGRPSYSPHTERSGFDGQRQGVARGYDQPGPGAQYPGQGYGQPFPHQQLPFAPPQAWQRKRSWPLRHKALTILFAFIGFLVIIVAANPGGSASSPSSSAGDTTVGTQASASASMAASNASNPASAQTLTYEVIGSAADVTYGPAGSTLSGTIPMKVNVKLGNAIYYSLTAQLQGGGRVTVKILINGKVISESNATGGYNIATAEISQDPLTGEWTDTNGPG